MANKIASGIRNTILIQAFLQISLALAVAAAITAPAAIFASEASPAAVSEEEVRESLKDRLKKASEEKSSQAMKVLGAQTKTAVLGKLTDITNSTLAITTREENEELVALNDETVFVRNGKTAAAADLQIGDFIIAMGNVNGDKILSARRVVAIDKEPARPSRVILLAKVDEINSDKGRFSAIEERPAELDGPQTYQVKVQKSVKFDWEQINSGQTIILIGIPDPDGERLLNLRAFKLR